LKIKYEILHTDGHGREDLGSGLGPFLPLLVNLSRRVEEWKENTPVLGQFVEVTVDLEPCLGHQMHPVQIYGFKERMSSEF